MLSARSASILFFFFSSLRNSSETPPEFYFLLCPVEALYSFHVEFLAFFGFSFSSDGSPGFLCFVAPLLLTFLFPRMCLRVLPDGFSLRWTMFRRALAFLS